MHEREPGFFNPRGIHMFCGEQGAGKTIACVEMMLRLQKQYPAAKMITNFGVTTENDELSKWQQLLEYTNGHKGVIVGIDEIQNWFMSGLNKLPEGMLEVATQNRKNQHPQHQPTNPTTSTSISPNNKPLGTPSAISPS